MPSYASRFNIIATAWLKLTRDMTLLQGSTNLEHIQIIKKAGGKLTDSYLDEGTSTYNPAALNETDFSHGSGFILDKTIGTNCPKRLENAKILIANTC